MRSYRVSVYAICKNEATFVDRWMDSMAEADEIVVLDTGSTDDTVEKLRARGARVEQKFITPWRFDAARNEAMKLISEQADICVCTDLDEVFQPGWRALLEDVWIPEAGQAAYRYTWSFNQDGSEGVVFWYEKIHARRGYQWIHPVHEVLKWTGEGRPGPTVVADGVQLDHHPDPQKSRGQYLGLLEQSVEEDPEDDRNVHYLGREYLFRERWADCIHTLKWHLSMPRATWKDERAASMRYIGKAYWMLGQQQQAQSWYLKAIAEAPHLREPWLDLAVMLYDRRDWEAVAWLTTCALRITQRPRTYISEAASWGSLPHDLRSIALYHMGRKEFALEEAKKARAIEPGNDRLCKNVELLERELKITPDTQG